jgi:hypothetical protein
LLDAVESAASRTANNQLRGAVVMPNIRDLLYDFASTGRESYALTDKALTHIVTALRRDSRFRNVTPSEFDLMLADARTSIENDITNILRDRVHIDDVEIQLGDFVGEDR